jgi:hypothetical protein
MEDFVDLNGGLLNIPLFYRTDAPLYIIRNWSTQLLGVIETLHEVGCVLRHMNLDQIFISRDGSRLKMNNFRGVGKVNNQGKIETAPNIFLTLPNNQPDELEIEEMDIDNATKDSSVKTFTNKALDSPFLAPEVLF